VNRIARELAKEIASQDWSDAPYRIDGARHNRVMDRTQSEQLPAKNADWLKLNVVWVVAQGLRNEDPNLDVHAFAEACGVADWLRLNRDGKPSGAIDAGIRPEPTDL
jgi:hypothetical protein